MNHTVRSRWTPADEAALAELQQRKERILDENMTPLRNLATEYAEELDLPLEEWMREHAGRIRDALEPFDTVRKPTGS